MFKVPILLYHDLESPDYPNEKLQSAARDTVVYCNNFEQQVRFFADSGYVGISLTDFLNYRSQNLPIPIRSILFTFDDGHYSNYFAFKILQSYGFKGTFFIISERIDTTFHLARNQIEEMFEYGMDIASHGHTHRYLPLLTFKDIQYELFQSKLKLESIIGDSIKFFAYPGGHYNRQSIEILRSTGYKAACSCIQGLNKYDTNPYLLKRIEIRRKAKLEDFPKLFKPSRLLFYQVIDIWKSNFRRSIGIEKYSVLRSRLFKYYPFKR